MPQSARFAACTGDAHRYLVILPYYWLVCSSSAWPSGARTPWECRPRIPFTAEGFEGPQLGQLARGQPGDAAAPADATEGKAPVTVEDFGRPPTRPDRISCSSSGSNATYLCRTLARPPARLLSEAARAEKARPRSRGHCSTLRFALISCEITRRVIRGHRGSAEHVRCRPPTRRSALVTDRGPGRPVGPATPVDPDEPDSGELDFPSSESVVALEPPAAAG